MHQATPACTGDAIVDLDEALQQPYGGERGKREAGELLKRMRAIGLSDLEPDPVRALEAKQGR